MFKRNGLLTFNTTMEGGEGSDRRLNVVLRNILSARSNLHRTSLKLNPENILFSAIFKDNFFKILLLNFKF